MTGAGVAGRRWADRLPLLLIALSLVGALVSVAMQIRAWRWGWCP